MPNRIPVNVWCEQRGSELFAYVFPWIALKDLECVVLISIRDLDVLLDELGM